MGLFDEVTKKFGQWIQVLDKQNKSVTIEDFDYGQGVHGEITTKHCEKCVSVNKCWFKDEKDKKPETYPILETKFFNDFTNFVTPGLYHYKCHCYENSIITPSVEDIKLVIPEGKDGWLFTDKANLIKSMGYEDNQVFLEVLCNCSKQAYCDGNYKIVGHNKYGARANFFLKMPGGGVKKDKVYNIKSAFMIFPNGKLKCNTFVGGWW